MSITVTIGYGDGTPLETAAQVDLLIEGNVAATASPNDAGQLIFDANVPANAHLAVRLHATAE